MENNKNIEQIVDNCYKFILDFQQKERDKVTQDEQALLSCQLSIIATLNDVAIKQAESKHLMDLKDKQFELEKSAKQILK